MSAQDDNAAKYYRGVPMEKLQSQPWTRALTIVGGIFLIFVPLVTIYGLRLISLPVITVLSVAVFFAWLYTRGVFSLPTKAGLAFSVLGAVLWETGWVVMILVDKRFGWGIFMAGWLLLTAGLMFQGVHMIKNGWLSSWNIYLCLFGSLPLIAEAANPFFFTSLLPLVQVVIMIFYGVGWVFIGKALTVKPQVAGSESLSTARAANPIQALHYPHAMGTD